MRIFLILLMLTANAAAQPTTPLPAPAIDEDSSPLAFLLAAKSAVEAGRWGEAQEALERAESRVLTRSERPSRASAPSTQQIVGTLQRARRAVEARDRAKASDTIGAALADTNS